MIRTRLLGLSLAAGMVASVLVAGTAAAASRTAGVANVWGSMGVWGTHTSFLAIWQITTTPGGSLYSLDDLQLTADVSSGRDCDPNICKAWVFSANAKFLNGANAQVGATLIPPDGSCYSSAIGPRDRLFSRCKSTPFTVSTAATKVKFTWTVSVQRPDGQWLNPWSASTTVAII